MATKRPFNFLPGTSLRAQMRQEGICACCSTLLIEEIDQGDYAYAHHVIPNQCGNPADPSHQWLRTEMNCVALCHACHMRVHQDGNTRSGAVAPPEYFPHSHKNPKLHAAWVAEVNEKAEAIWKYLDAKATSSST